MPTWRAAVAIYGSLLGHTPSAKWGGSRAGIFRTRTVKPSTLFDALIPAAPRTFATTPSPTRPLLALFNISLATSMFLAGGPSLYRPVNLSPRGPPSSTLSTAPPPGSSTPAVSQHFVSPLPQSLLISDAFTPDMMRRFNNLPNPPRISWFGNSKLVEPPSGSMQPLVYNTIQGYLRRTPEYLAHTIAAARAENYALGMQLVGGAYHPYELNTHRAASASRASAPPHAP
ncbi:hypothetical protein C8Q76DRAFT_799400 [Earliella scabrosa]|nr:hypothetical protein C8Q76DRAFT_799400 [Earliella scabrosa]